MRLGEVSSFAGGDATGTESLADRVAEAEGITDDGLDDTVGAHWEHVQLIDHGVQVFGMRPGNGAGQSVAQLPLPITFAAQ